MIVWNTGVAYTLYTRDWIRAVFTFLQARVKISRSTCTCLEISRMGLNVLWLVEIFNGQEQGHLTGRGGRWVRVKLSIAWFLSVVYCFVEISLAKRTWRTPCIFNAWRESSRASVKSGENKETPPTTSLLVQHVKQRTLKENAAVFVILNTFWNTCTIWRSDFAAIPMDAHKMVTSSAHCMYLLFQALKILKLNNSLISTETWRKIRRLRCKFSL